VIDRFSTQTVHAGEERRKPYGALTTPIVQTSTYTFRDTAEVLAFMQEKADGAAPVRDEYGRYSNPTQTAAERKLAALEGGERALLFASGMSAITTTMTALLSRGDHLVMLGDCYHRTREFALSFLNRWGIETTLVRPGQPGAFAEAVQPNTRLLFAETPTNPYLRVVDLEGMVAVARQHGILTLVDSTFATPVNLRPLALGVDLVAHSATKYLGGHNDLLAGTVIGPAAMLARIEHARGVLGGVSNPHDAYLLLRGLKTLDLRVRRQNENGLRVARFLEAHPAVRRVYYPGLPSHPDHELARRQMGQHGAAYGGVVSFEIEGDFERTGCFVDHLRVPYIGPTLGGVESIVEQPAALFSLDPAARRAAGLEDNLVRYALGIEDAEDLIADLAQALAAIHDGEVGSRSASF
jgi:cystathionine gamma-synthase